MLKFCSKTAWERNSNFHTIVTKMCNQIINCMPWKLKKNWKLNVQDKNKIHTSNQKKIHSKFKV